jgi:hypothetical protein
MRSLLFTFILRYGYSCAFTPPSLSAAGPELPTKMNPGVRKIDDVVDGGYEFRDLCRSHHKQRSDLQNHEIVAASLR